MAAEQLQIQVQANVQQAITSLNNFNKQLDATAKSTESLGTTSLNVLNNQLQRLQRIAANPNLNSDQYARLAKLINNTSKEVNTLTKSLTTLGAANVKAASGTGQANTALVNFGRVVQDAPFGIIGIANNIDPLLSSFQNLKRETGSTGSAFKALAASLTGPAGVAIAVSSVTSLLIAFGPKIGNYLSGVSSVQNGLNDIAFQSAEAFRKAQLEFQKLSGVITSSSSSYEQQQLALGKINSSLKEYGVEITNVAAFQQSASTIGILYAQIKAEEARNTALAAASAKSYAEEIEAQNKVQKFAGQEILLKNLPLIGNQLLSLVSKFQKYNAESDKENAAGSQKAFNQAITESNINLQNLIDQLSKVKGVKPIEIKTPKKEVDEISKLIQQYKKDIEGINWDEQNRGLDGTNDRLDTALDALKEITLKGVNPTAASFRFLTAEVDKFRLALDYKNFKDNLEKINSEVKAQGAVRAQLDKELKSSLANATNLINQQIKSEKALSNFRLKEFEKQIELQKQLQQSIEGGLTNAFTSVFDALIDGENVFEALSKSVKQLVSDLIRVVIQMTVVKAITNALFPNAGASADALFTFKMRSDVILKSLGRAY